MPTHASSSTDTSPKTARRARLGRMVGGVALAAILALSFMGHLTPQMQIQWANFMSMCGF